MLATLLLPAVAIQAPLDDSVDSFPLGPQNAIEVTPDGSMMFVGEGAAVALVPVPLYTNPTGPSARVPVGCFPRALRYADLGMEQDLFAAGSAGLFRVQLCATLPCASYSVERLDVGTSFPTYADYERKRWVDVEVVTGNASSSGAPLLFALQAASSDAEESHHGGTVLWAFRRDPTTLDWTPWASTSFPAPGANPPNSSAAPMRPAAGSALTVDPGDNTRVYAALGKDSVYDSGTGTRKNRIWSVSIGLSGGIPTLTPSPILFPGQPSRVENVRDMVVVRTPYSVPQKAYLYATLAYTGILEYDISAGTSATYAVPCGFPERIDAASDGTNILLAMGLGTEGPAANDSTTGVRGTGLWRDTCLSVGVGDPDDPGVSCISGQVSTRTDYYVKVPSTPPALRLTKVSAASLWNGLRLVQRSSVNFWAYANSVGAGTVVDIVSFPDGLQTNPPPPQLVIPVVNERFRYKDYGFVAFTCVASEINPELVSVGGDGGGAVLGAGSGLLFLGKTSVPDLPGIAGTELCPGATPDSTECLRAPGLFGVWNGPSAHWIDPADPTREWFVRGFITREPCGANVCDDPCAGGIERRWQEAPVPAEHSKVGWLMTNIEPTAAGSGMPSSATVMDAKGWQYAPKPAPSLPGRAGVNPPLLSEDDALPDPKPGESAAETSISNYVFTAIDPRRNEAGHPLLLSMTRARSAFGLKLFRPSQMTDVDSQACAAGPEKLDPLLEKTAPAGDGIGEHHVLTHLELDTVTCNPGGVCPVAGSPAQEFSNQGATFFEVRDSLGVSHWVVGVSAGYNVIPASEAACPWATYSAQAMAVLYDVTQTGDAFLPPRLLRVALATPETGEPDDPHLRSLSWGPMAVKSYGEGPAARTIAFLGDAMGRVLAFDVSYDQLYPEATTPYLVSPTQVNPVIFPMKSKVLPYDPYDGQHANVVRVIEHEDMLYVAAGRDGIAILDVANPADAAFLEFVDVLDTPGMAMEVLVRRIEDPAPPESQLLECDAGGGIRVYH